MPLFQFSTTSDSVHRIAISLHAFAQIHFEANWISLTCLIVIFNIGLQKRAMATATFLGLPAEVHVAIARYCTNSDLINLCRTCKRTNERCLHVLYRHVDLQGVQSDEVSAAHREDRQLSDSYMRQQRWVRTLLSHPEYGKHVRSFNGTLLRRKSFLFARSGEKMISEEELWGAMLLLTHVQSVNVGAILRFRYLASALPMNIPNHLFQSATSVTLAGKMPYNLAKTILGAINPAMLKHLCLDMVQDFKSDQQGYSPGTRGEDGRIVAHGAMTGLLPILTGRCTSLRTLILRRLGQTDDLGDGDWHAAAAAEETSYVEWASFIRSVRGTVEKFTFEHSRRFIRSVRSTNTVLPFKIMDEKFGRLLFPTIVLGIWPCLTLIELKGVRGSDVQGGTAGLTMELRAVLGLKTWVVVTEQGQFFEDRPLRFNSR